MTKQDIVKYRLYNQKIANSTFQKPEDVVAWFGGVQAQDYAAAKWAIGLRIPDITEDVIEQAFSDGFILRTHVLRPTWHFVVPADLRWMLALTAPRIKATCAYYNRRLELDEAIFLRTNSLLRKVLQGNNQLTRIEIESLFKRNGILADNLRLIYILIRAELDGIICSGARRGKQFTYALFEDRVPEANTLTHDEALVELTKRYFTSRGPATLKDYIWWSGLTALDAKKGLELVKSQLTHELIDGKEYWFTNTPLRVKNNQFGVSLLPNFDEYIVGYTNRNAIFDPSHIDKLNTRSNPLFQNTIVMNGHIVGTWKRKLTRNEVLINTNLFTSLNQSEHSLLESAAYKYSRFLNLSLLLS